VVAVRDRFSYLPSERPTNPECDNCYGACPDNAVIKLGPWLRYEIDYDYCKGCGICAAECPCGAITMEPEQT
jgi:2-oxoacid:acceptor oxidoreductase delta subunit (pyruvate/2-ketoisovalerate family)